MRRFAMSTFSAAIGSIVSSIRCYLVMGAALSAVLLAGCVSQSSYDKLKAENQELQQQVATQAADIDRLRGAIKYTVNSDLLFPSGGWQLSARGQQIITNMAAKLAPTQQNKILLAGYTDNQPVGRALQ